ncbi:MAG: OmpA family protein [Bacteroidales bacterium]|nr:OmpA family protein [Bacteroidales bacterium]
MKLNTTVRLMILLALAAGALDTSAQSYTVGRASFNSERYDDYSPVQFRDGIVFCSNRKHDVMVVYSSSNQFENVNMWFIPVSDTTVQEDARIFSKEMLTNFHDGPATFNREDSVIYYSRNNEVDSKLRDVFDSENQLGLFSAQWIEGKWDSITAFTYNNPEHSLTTPALSYDGNRIYFASDMPGGFGGADLYYCDRDGRAWLPPVNLGSNINSTGNESYPFESESGILYFASDGWIGLGQKDIYYTKQIDGEWLLPVHLDAPINSKADDFALITDKNAEEGYFSSNRKRNDDIYIFKTDIHSFFNCDSLQKNYYCYLFYDEGFMDVDTLPLSYEWSFGDGTRIRGIEAEHCFPGPGNYTVELNIIDNNTGNTFFTQTSYDVEITDAVQPFITSPDMELMDQQIEFSGLNSNLPDMEITQYFWDFGDGTKIKGAEIMHTYERKGSYNVQLGVTGKKDSTGYLPKACVYKQIEILEDNQDMAMYLARQKGELAEMPDIVDPEESMSNPLYSMQEAIEKDAVFRVEVLTSESRLDIDTALFDPLRGAYDITEVYLREDSLYSYTVGEATSVLETYPIYNDVISRGYENASVKSYVLADLAEEELLELTSSLGEFADAYFEFNDYMIGEASYPILNRVAEIMQKYPGIALEIAAHTDNMGSFEYNMKLSQKRAQSMVDYLVSQGIDSYRLIGRGYGESRPIAANITEEGRSINRRVEFIILNESE